MSSSTGITTLARDNLSPSLTQRLPHDVEAQSLLRPNPTASDSSVASDWKRRPATFWSLALVLTVLPLTWYYWTEIPLLQNTVSQHAVANFFTFPNSTAFTWPSPQSTTTTTPPDVASTPASAVRASNEPTSAVSQWLALHDAAAVAADSDANLCGARTYITYQCCGGNFGTTLMRAVAAVKLAMQLNRTVLLDMSLTHPRGGGPEASYFDWALPTEDDVRARLRRNGCEGHLFHTPQFEYGLPETSIELPYDWQTEPQWITNDTAICTDPNAPSVGEWYKHLRCSDLVSQPNPLLGRVVRLGGFDLWQWHKLLELNPYWLQSPLRDTFSYQVNKLYHREIFDALIKPSAGVQSVIDTFVNQDAVPQQTQQAYGPGWTGVVHFRTARPEENDPLTHVAVRELLKQLAPYNYSQALLPAKLPIFVSSAQIPSQEVCNILLNNLTLALAELNLPKQSTGNQFVDCRFFDAHQYAQLHSPLPAGVNIDHVNYQPYDWGVEPSWAAVVNLFAVKQTRGFLVALESSSFAAVMRLTSKMESYGTDGRYNSRAGYWPF